jgi:hypothetical protein
MSTDSVNSTPTKTAKAVAPVIRLDFYGESDSRRILRRQVPAWLVSVGLHVVLLGFIIVFHVFFGEKYDNDLNATEEAAINTEVEDKPEDKNFDNPDVGLDPNLPTNYNVDRIEDHSVPGKVLPDEPIGNNMGDGPATTLPPPPGIGTEGQGGGIEAPTAGVGGLGQAGGMGGPNIAGMGFKGRSGSTRQKMLQQGGGNSVTEACVTRGLIWLAKVQKTDGSWEIDGGHKSKVAGTGIALLPFLAAGQTHKGGVSNEGKDSSKYTKNVLAGINYLLKIQRPSGDFGTQNMYDHAIATIAVCEAYGMTKDPKILPMAQNAINFIVKAQHSGGGWRYSPGQPGDTSVTGWQVQALTSAVRAQHIKVPKEAFTRVSNYLASVEGGSGASAGKTYGYTEKAGSASMTAVGLLCREYLGWGPRKLAAGVETLKAKPPKKRNMPTDPQAFDIYYYYYATQVMHNYGGEDWAAWNLDMREWLIGLQNKGDEKAPNYGSWNQDQSHTGSAGGRLVTTALSLLTLEVYYRYLPLYRRDGGLKELEGS